MQFADIDWSLGLSAAFIGGKGRNFLLLSHIQWTLATKP